MYYLQNRLSIMYFEYELPGKKWPHQCWLGWVPKKPIRQEAGWNCRPVGVRENSWSWSCLRTTVFHIGCQMRLPLNPAWADGNAGVCFGNARSNPRQVTTRFLRQVAFSHEKQIHMPGGFAALGMAQTTRLWPRRASRRQTPRIWMSSNARR